MMNLEQMRARLAAIVDELRAIHDEAGDAALTGEQTTRWDALVAEREQLQANIARIEQRERVFAAIDRGTLRRESGDGARAGEGYDRDPLADPRDNDPIRGRGNPWADDLSFRFGQPAAQVAGELRSRAIDAASRMPGSTDAQRATLVRMLEEQDNEQGDLARHVLIASNPHYLSGFSKGLRGQMWDLTDAEKRAMRATQDLARAMSLTDGAGGFLIPQQLDPTLILTSDGSVNPFRQIATLKIATSDVWTGVSTTHAAWSYDAEGTEVSDDATTFAQPSIPLYTARGFIPISIEGLAYEPNVTQVIARVLAGGKDDLEASTFAVGTGTAQPTGIVTALVASAPTVVVNSAATDTFAIADVYNLEEQLPSRYRARAQWAANKSTYNDIRQFGVSDGHALWERVGNGQPPELLGYRVNEASAMDGVINATVNNYTLALGDWSYYYIADRMGMVVEQIPHLFALANNRPSGQRGFFAYCMHGADSVNDGAFRLLNVT